MRRVADKNVNEKSFSCYIIFRDRILSVKSALPRYTLLTSGAFRDGVSRDDDHCTGNFADSGSGRSFAF